jgi:hypothetical protein
MVWYGAVSVLYRTGVNMRRLLLAVVVVVAVRRFFVGRGEYVKMKVSEVGKGGLSLDAAPVVIIPVAQTILTPPRSNLAERTHVPHRITSHHPRSTTNNVLARPLCRQ